MAEVVAALLAAARCLVVRRMLGLVFWPLLGALVLWALVAGLFWHEWLNLVQHAVSTPWLASMFGAGLVAFVGGAAAWLIALPVLLLVILATALIVTSVFGMPVMVKEIADRYFPQLERYRGGTGRGSIGSAVSATLVYLILMLLSIPLWFIVPFGGFLLPLLLNAWFNARIFRYDALSEHASADECRDILRRCRARMYVMGLLLAVLQWICSATLLLIPFVLFFLPVYAGLAFVHLLLEELAQLRAAAGPRVPATRDASPR